MSSLDKADELTTPGSSSGFSLHPGDRLGRYIIMSEVGRGGMAVVYKAHQPDLDRVVAVKILSNIVVDSRFVERFQAEARAVAKINHPNVIKIHEVGEAGGIHFLVMEYVQGMDLGAYLNRKKPNFYEVVEIVRQLSDALAYCHKQGIIHRDLKPSNILMNNSIPVIIDFGLAKAVEAGLTPTLTLSGEVVGSPAYMSPEQAMGRNVGVLSDICSLGIIIYELISFKNPYLDPRSVHQTALNAIRAEPIPLRYLSPWLDKDFAAIVHMALSKDERTRYQSMDLFLRDIQAYQQGEPVMAKPPSVLSLVWRFVKANPALYWMGLTIFAVAAVVVGFVTVQEENRIAPWALLDTVHFGRSGTVSFNSVELRDGRWRPSKAWEVVNGRLEGRSKGLSAAVSKQDFFGDLKLEFWITGLEGMNGDFNAFLYGQDPGEGFRFSLGEWGGLMADIQVGNMRAYSSIRRPIRLNAGKTYKVTVAKDGNRLQLLMDDAVVTEKYYTLPVRVSRANRIGFYTHDSHIAIDSMRIYRRGIALAANPTVVADAYLEEGFIQNSILSYKQVIETYPNRNVSYEAELKLGKCYLVMGEPEQALPHLTNSAGFSRDSRMVPSALFHLAQCYQSMGRRKDALDKLALIPQVYPKSEYNSILVASRMEAVYDCLDSRKDQQTCAEELMEEMRFLIRYEDPLRLQFGTAFVQLAEILRRKGIDSPIRRSKGLLKYFTAEPAIHGPMLLLHARQLLGQGKYDDVYKVLHEVLALDVLPSVRSESEFLMGVTSFLLQRYDAARLHFEQVYQDHGQAHGMAFRTLVHSYALSAMGQKRNLAINAGVFVNPTISRSERTHLSLLEERIEFDEWESHQTHSSIAPLQFLSLEEALIPFLYLHAKRGPTEARQFLKSRLNAFPPGTYEGLYWKELLERYRIRYSSRPQ